MSGPEAYEPCLRRGLEEMDQEELYYFAKIYQNWKVITGDPLYRHSKPARVLKRLIKDPDTGRILFKRQGLEVWVETGAYATHLRFFEKAWLENIEQSGCPKKAVEFIQFRVQSFSSVRDRIDRIIDKSLELRKKSQEPVKADPASHQQASTAAGGIGPSRTKRAFRRFMATSLAKHKPQEEGNNHEQG